MSAPTAADTSAAGPAAVSELRARLLTRAYLFDDPASYAAGVEAALATLCRG